MSKKLCVECKHMIVNELGIQFAECGKQKMKFDLVAGTGERAFPKYCETNRGMDWFSARLWNGCGRSGRWWDAK